MSRRAYALTVLGCLAGAGLAVWASTRVWSLQVTPRAGMSSLRTARTGTDLEPWLLGLALVALAGTGALLATHGWARRALGVLLALAGLGAITGAVLGRSGLSAGEASPAWPFLAVLGGALITAAGLTAARHGHQWPAMSARYDRHPTPPPPPGAAAQPAPASATPPQDNRAAWDALDQGKDPTAL